mgnify:CR=1 FL=1
MRSMAVVLCVRAHPPYTPQRARRHKAAARALCVRARTHKCASYGWWSKRPPDAGGCDGSFPAETALDGRGNAGRWQMTFFRVSDVHEHA